MPDHKIIRLSPNPAGMSAAPDELDPELFVSGLPVQHSHAYFEDEAQGLFIGVWDTDDMTEAAGPYACDEFMWLIEGEAAIKNMKSGALQKAVAGQAFVIPKGYACQWQQKGYLRKFHVISEHPEEDIPDVPSHEGIVIPGEDAGTPVSTPLTPFTGTGGAVTREEICYQDPRGRFVAGTWSSERLETGDQLFPFHQFFCVHDGSITVIDAAGAAHVFNKGDAFFVSEGARCRARVDDRVYLFYAVVRPR